MLLFVQSASPQGAPVPQPPAVVEFVGNLWHQA
jgi:hypothetical protein